MSTEIATPSPMARSERGKMIRHTEAEVDAALRLLVANGGKTATTAKQLAEEGLEVSYDTLRLWRDQTFPHRYMQLRTAMGREVAEKVAGSAMERAQEVDALQREAIRKTVEKLDEVDANHLPKAVQSLANAKAQDIQSAQLLRNQPTQITRVDLSESIATLERLGVIEGSGEVVDAEVVDE